MKYYAANIYTVIMRILAMISISFYTALWIETTNSQLSYNNELANWRCLIYNRCMPDVIRNAWYNNNTTFKTHASFPTWYMFQNTLLTTLAISYGKYQFLYEKFILWGYKCLTRLCFPEIYTYAQLSNISARQHFLPLYTAYAHWI